MELCLFEPINQVERPLFEIPPLQRQNLFTFVYFPPIYAVHVPVIVSLNQAFHTMESISIVRPLVRPLYLWPHFNKAFEFIAGYPTDNFEFIVGQTPLSTFNETFLFVVSYYVIIFGGRELMRDRAPFQLSSSFLAHNFCLAVISSVLLAL